MFTKAPNKGGKMPASEEQDQEPVANPGVRKGSRGYQPLDAQGRLTQVRPDGGKVQWSRMPVGREAAFDVFLLFTERERAVLHALEQRRYLTAEQIGRRFYGSYNRAKDVMVK